MKRIVKVAEKVQHEVVLIGGAIVTVGEVLTATLPAGTAQTVVRVALPIVVTVVQRSRTLPLPLVEAIIAKVEARSQKKT